MDANMAIQALAEQREDLFSRQRDIATRGHALAAALLREIFAATPLLEKVDVTFEYDWRTKAGQPYRKCLAMARVTFSVPIVPVEMLTTYLSKVRADSPTDADDLALQFQLYLEDQGILARIGEMLDVGDHSASICKDRESLLPSSGAHPVLLGEFAEVL